MIARVSVLLVAVTCIPLVPTVDANAQPLDSPSVRVGVTLVLKDHVSGLAWIALVEECRRIWLAEGVSITWDGRAPAGARLDVQIPVAFDDQELRRRAHADAFGVTIFSGRQQRVVVSERRVREWVSHQVRSRVADSGDSMVLDSAVGRVLGRVLAHELGHVLLRSMSHADTGLMSASLQTHDLTPSTRASDTLSASERTYIKIRFADGAGLPPRPDLPAPVLARDAGLGGTAVVPIMLRDAP
jgi:hypothetical protein